MTFSVQEFPDATLTNEEENWIRLSFLLIDEGTIWVREGILTKHLNDKGLTLQSFLTSTKGMLERAWRGDTRRSKGKRLVRKLLSDEQFNTLFPYGNPALSAVDFDLPLLITLLGWLKIVQVPNVEQGWSSTDWPDDTYTDLGSDLLRMRYMRRMLMLSNECSIENDEFDKYWDKLKEILISLGADITKIDDIKDLKGSNEKRTHCIERITTLFTKDMEAAEKFAEEKMAELAKNHGSNMEERPTRIKMYMEYPDGSKHEM